MRKSKTEAAKTRERIVQAAAAEFREKGIVATGLADLMAAAGLTHGGFYKHFKSKDDLVCEVAKQVLADAAPLSHCDQPPCPEQFEAIVAAYLCPNHRENPRSGCVFATLGSEIARANAQTRSVVTGEIEKFIDLLAGQLSCFPPAEARRRATTAACTMVGAMVLARICSDATMAESILSNAKAAALRAKCPDSPA
jgi:TetR/AcrR family transcriptional regulator, transcriptional repressor for nem operon